MPCVAHLGEVAQAHPRLTSAGISVVIIAQAKPKNVKFWLAKQEPLPFPIVSDHERTGYRTFQLPRVSWWHFFRPSVVFSYLKHMVHGHKVQKPVEGEDLLQLGGDFILDRERRLIFSYISQTATDRPSIDTLIQSIPG